MKYEITCEMNVPILDNPHLDIPAISRAFIKKAIYSLNKSWGLKLKNINVKSTGQRNKHHGKT